MLLFILSAFIRFVYSFLIFWPGFLIQLHFWTRLKSQDFPTFVILKFVIVPWLGWPTVPWFEWLKHFLILIFRFWLPFPCTFLHVASGQIAAYQWPLVSLSPISSAVLKSVCWFPFPVCFLIVFIEFDSAYPFIAFHGYFAVLGLLSSFLLSAAAPLRFLFGLPPAIPSVLVFPWSDLPMRRPFVAAALPSFLWPFRFLVYSSPPGLWGQLYPWRHLLVPFQVGPLSVVSGDFGTLSTQ